MSKCKWREDEDGVWDTGCDNRFEFNAGGPPENDFEYCPYCGKKLKAHRFRTRRVPGRQLKSAPITKR